MSCMDGFSCPRRRDESSFPSIFRMAKLQAMELLGVHAACTWRVGTIDMDPSVDALCIAMHPHVASGCQLVKVGAARAVGQAGYPCMVRSMLRSKATIAFVCAYISYISKLALGSRVRYSFLDNLERSSSLKSESNNNTTNTIIYQQQSKATPDPATFFNSVVVQSCIYS